MKVAFVHPPAWAPWAPSYAMALLSAGAKQRGHSFLGFDLNIDFHNAVSEDDKKLWLDENVIYWEGEKFLESFISRYSVFIDAYVDEIVATGVSLCAFSVNSASTKFANLIAQKIKERDNSIFILFGGPDCYRSEAGLKILENPNVDAICTGEADHAWPDFLDMFEKNNFSIGECKGFCYKKDDGNIVDCGPPDLVSDLNNIPFADYEDINFNKYTLSNRICLMMSRGCINRCAYCSEGPNFLRYRYRSPKNLFAEVKKQVELLRRVSNQRPHINFSDSLINGKPEVLETFCDMVIQDEVDFSWGGMALLRKEMTRDLLLKMKNAGCIELCWGLESGSTGVLKLMRKKHYDPELAEVIIRIASELGYDQYGNIMIGFPGETEELFLETVQFVIRNKDFFISLGLPLMQIKKNSYLHDNYQKYRIESPDILDQWKTTDNSNTYELRLARRNLLSTILQDKLFDQGRYDQTKIKEVASEDSISNEEEKDHGIKNNIIRFRPELDYLHKRFPKFHSYLASFYQKKQTNVK